MTNKQGPFAPYYERDGYRLYLGACEDVLPCLEGGFDLLATDPPYGVNFQSGYRADALEKIAGDDGSYDVRGALEIACRSLKEGRHAYVFGPEGYLPDVLTARTSLIWDKSIVGMGDLKSPWGPAHEPITFAVYRPSKADRASGRGNLAARMRQGSVLKVQRPHGKGVNRHPTEKPIALMRRLIESSSSLGETVLDPFAGCGSTLVAAALEGRKGVGVEIDPAHAQTAAARLDAVLDWLKEGETRGF